MRRVVPLAAALTLLGLVSWTALARDDATDAVAVRVSVLTDETPRAPVPGVRVVVRDPVGAAAISVAETDEDGDATLFVVPTRKATRFAVEASGAGRALATRWFTPERRTRRGPQGAAPAPDITFCLEPGAPYKATVLDDATGRPVAGAAVRIRTSAPGAPDGCATTDDEGTLRIEGLGRARLFVVARGHVPLARDVDGTPPVPADASPLRLEPAGTVRGRVVNARGRAVSGAVVAIEVRRSFWSPAGDVTDDEAFALATVRTGGDGSFALPVAPAGVRFGLILREGDRDVSTRQELQAGDLHRDFVLSPERPELDEVLRPAGEVADPAPSLVVDVAGACDDARPAGVSGALFPAGEDWRVATSAGAPLVFRGVPPGRYRLEVTASNVTAWSADVEIGARPQTTRTSAVLGGAATIEGRVIDERGEPVAGARIDWGPLVRGFGLQWDAFGGVCDAKGRFRIAGLLPGRCRVSAAAEGHARIGAADLVAPATDARIVLPRTGKVTLRLSAPGAGVLPERLASQEGIGICTDGVVEMTCLAAGPHHLVLEAREPVEHQYLPIVIDVGVKAGATVDAGTVELDRGATVSGRALGPDGRPAAGARIVCGSAETVSSAEGRFAIAALPRGRVVLSAAWGSAIAQESLDAAHPPQDVTLRLVAMRPVRVQVGGDRRRCFSVEATPRGATRVAYPAPLTTPEVRWLDRRPDARGVAFLRLPPGEWTLRALGEDDEAVGESEIVVPADGDVPVEASLAIR